VGKVFKMEKTEILDDELAKKLEKKNIPIIKKK
jgi:hypothetical protein